MPLDNGMIYEESAAMDDHELIAEACKGDTAAFETLIFRYDEQVLSMARSYVGDEDDAKDIYQEVFIRVFKALPKFQFKSQFSTWLYRIVINVCLTYHARKKGKAFVPVEEEYNDNPDDEISVNLVSDMESDGMTINNEINRHIEEAMEALSPQQKIVFTMRHYEGFKLREIAQMMQCAEGTVKKYLFSATERMRGKLRTVYP